MQEKYIQILRNQYQWIYNKLMYSISMQFILFPTQHFQTFTCLQMTSTAIYMPIEYKQTVKQCPNIFININLQTFSLYIKMKWGLFSLLVHSNKRINCLSCILTSLFQFRGSKITSIILLFFVRLIMTQLILLLTTITIVGPT